MIAPGMKSSRLDHLLLSSKRQRKIDVSGEPYDSKRRMKKESKKLINHPYVVVSISLQIYHFEADETNEKKKTLNPTRTRILPNAIQDKTSLRLEC